MGLPANFIGGLRQGEGSAEQGSGALYPEPMDYEIDPLELSQLRDQAQQFVLLDVREPWEFQTAKIEGSLLMPMGDVPGRAHQELDPEARIITVCHHGMRSLNVAVWLRNQGFESAQSLRGGIDGWSAAVDPQVPRY
jgi:rhodanese-related sulfurtransferase